MGSRPEITTLRSIHNTAKRRPAPRISRPDDSLTECDRRDTTLHDGIVTNLAVGYRSAFSKKRLVSMLLAGIIAYDPNGPRRVRESRSSEGLAANTAAAASFYGLSGNLW
jgi:hypothetical protein